MAAKKAVSAVRKKIRFPADPGTYAELRVAKGKPLTLHGLVVNESQSGFAVVVISGDKFKKGTLFHCTVGHLSETPATLQWSATLEEGVQKLGFEYHFD